MIEANIGLLTTDLYLNPKRAISETNFDRYIESKISKIDNKEIKNNYLDKSVTILNDYDFQNFNKDSEKNFTKFDMKI